MQSEINGHCCSLKNLVIGKRSNELKNAEKNLGIKIIIAVDFPVIFTNLANDPEIVLLFTYYLVQFLIDFFRFAFKCQMTFNIENTNKLHSVDSELFVVLNSIVCLAEVKIIMIYL